MSWPDMPENPPTKMCEYCDLKCDESCKVFDGMSEPEFFELNGELY